MTTRIQKRKMKDPFFNRLPKEIEIEDLLHMGFIQITYVGSENMYFKKEEKKYFCKIER